MEVILNLSDMLRHSIEVAVAVTIGLMGLAWMKAVVEPTSKVLGQILFPKVAAEALVVLDRLIPQLLADGATAEQMEQRYRDALEAHFEDPSWQRRGLGFVWERFDVRVLLNHAAEGAHEGS